MSNETERPPAARGPVGIAQQARRERQAAAQSTQTQTALPNPATGVSDGEAGGVAVHHAPGAPMPEHGGTIPLSEAPPEIREAIERDLGNQQGGDPNVRAMSFGQALDMLKAGLRVARAGWNGKGMFIFLVPGSTFTVNREPLLSIMGEGTAVSYHAHIDMKTAQGYVVPWLASQADMLSDDWQIAD